MIAARRAVAPLPSVGSDFGLTGDGPVLVEANIGGSALTILLRAEVPLSGTGLTEAFMHHWKGTDRRGRAPQPE